MPLVLFDIDGTLLAGGDPVHARAFEAACRALFGVDGSLAGADLAGRTDRRILLALLAPRGLPAPDEPRLLEAFAFMEDFVERELTAPIAHRVLPGVRDLLEALGRESVDIGLVTGNLPRIARAKLRRAGLDRHFGAVGGFGDRSPDRADLVRAALDQAGVPAAEALVVGDTRHDVEAGRSCGVRTVGVATGRTPARDLRAAGADRVVDTLEDVAGFLAFLRA